MRAIFLALFGVLTSVFLLHYWLVGQAVYGDGIYYWAYVRSVVIDHDLALTNELRHTYSPQGNNTLEKVPNYPETAREKALAYHLPIGPAIGWLPFFLLAHYLGLLLSSFGLPILLNGYASLYQLIVGMGNVLYGVLGVWVMYKTVQLFYSQKIALGSVMLLLFASNLVYYTSIDVLNSHPFSFFLSSIFFYLWTRAQEKKEIWQWWIIGIILGLLISTRTQECLFVILVLGGMSRQFLLEKKQLKIKKALQLLKQSTVFFVGCFVGMFPQVVIWKYAYAAVPYGGAKSFDFLRPHLLGLLINLKTGLLLYTPIITIAFIGLWILMKKKKSLVVVYLIFLLCEYYVIASWNAWDQAASYGIRMLLTSIPILAMGLAEIIQLVSKKYSFRAVNIVALLLIILNGTMILRFHLYIKDPTFVGNTVTRREAVKKINRVFHTNWEWFGKN